MANSECVFCKIIAGQIPATKLYEDENVLAFLDIGPISDGHTLVIAKEHCEKIHQCRPESLAKVWQVMPKIAGAVSAALECPGYNILCNNGRAAGQVVEHLHFHIIPRRSGDGLLDGWPAYKYGEGKMETIAEKILAKLK
jgi:histidine triad (HIT) family protein